PYAFVTEDYGRTWRSITNGIPEGDFTLTIREDVVQPGLLYLGTEKRVWVSFDNGASWKSLQRNMPVVQIADIASTREDIAIATHGRSFYIMYDVAPRRQMAPTDGEVAGRTLFEGPPAGRSVDDGASLYYSLPDTAASVKVEILDQQGALIRAFEASASDTTRRPQAGGPGGGGFGGGM